MQRTSQEPLSGTEFERLVQRRLDKYRMAGKADIRRSGVHAVMTTRGWEVLPSKPDFEGMLQGPRPVLFDCKVCSQASFNLAPYRDETKGARSHQLSFMVDRARYGVQAFFLLHWNARELQTKAEEAVTYIFPVDAEMEFWRGFFAGETKSIKRQDCEELGRVVPWNLFGERDRSVQPDILAVL